MNKKLLHLAVKGKGYNNEDVAQMLGISRGSYQARLNGSVQFTIGEVKKVQEYLGLNDGDVLAIFFANNVQ